MTHASPAWIAAFDRLEGPGHCGDCYPRDVSDSHRDLELAGSPDVVTILREVFTALSNGRVLPTAPTSTNHVAYSHETTSYLTFLGDGLTMTEQRDYGEWHCAVFPSLVVGDITITSVGHPRGPDAVLRISGPAARIDGGDGDRESMCPQFLTRQPLDGIRGPDRG